MLKPKPEGLRWGMGRDRAIRGVAPGHARATLAEAGEICGRRSSYSEFGGQVDRAAEDLLLCNEP